MTGQSIESGLLLDPAILKATCKDNNGKAVEKHVDLDTVLGNEDGHFKSGVKFSSSAKDIHLEGLTLHADLRRYNNSWAHSTVDLNNRFGPDEFSAAPPERCQVCQGWPNTVSICKPSVRALRGQREQCVVCALLVRIVDHLAKQDSRFADPDTQCWACVTEEGPLLNKTPMWFLDFSLPGNDKRRPLEKRYTFYKERSASIQSKTFAAVRGAKHVRYSPTSDESIKEVAAWIKQCEKKHKSCTSTEGTLPLRVLDLGTSGSSPVKLKITDGEKAKYVCLSYSWGDAVGAQLRDETFEQFLNRVEVHTLPKTYQDAIAFCRRMGVQYLWIDALCIKQKNIPDWQSESVKMADYYGGCHFCITATSSSSLDKGCNATMEPVEFRGNGRDGKPYSVYIRPKTTHLGEGGSHNMIHFPLLTRAWCYQERRLAPRIIHFCGEELLFECDESTVCQCNGAEDPNEKGNLNFAWTKNTEVFYVNHTPISSAKDESQKAMYMWHAYVSSFSRLAISHRSDWLVAMSGLAEKTQERRKKAGIDSGRYLAGLWENFLIEDLGWCVGKDLTKLRAGGKGFGFGSVTDPQEAKMPRPPESKIPSWSWASVQDPVHYNVPLSNPLCKIIHAETTQDKNEKALGRVTGGHIILRAKLKASRWERHVSDVLNISYWALNDFKGQWGKNFLKWFPDYDLSSLHEKELFLMPLASRARLEKHGWIAKAMSLGNMTVYLVLRHKHANTYERVGWAYTEGAEADMGSAEEKEIRLE